MYHECILIATPTHYLNLCNARSFLHHLNSITPLLTFRLAALANQVSIVPPPREIDPRILAWKGISTLSKLECSNDLWIRREDWECLGLRAVKERAFYFA